MVRGTRGPKPAWTHRAHHNVAVDPTLTPPPPSARASSRSRRAVLSRWPFGILAVAVLRLLDAAFLATLGSNARDLPTSKFPFLAGDSTLIMTADLTVAALTVIGVIGLLLFKRWGWVLTMVMVGLALLLDLIFWSRGEPSYPDLLLHVITAFYLNGRSVRTLALGDGDPGDDSPR